jgi:hypothetical protein
MEYKSNFQPPDNISNAIPAGESVLWMGKPSFWGLSWHMFGIKWLFYYLIILFLAFVLRLGAADFLTAVQYDFIPFLTSGLLAMVFLFVLSGIQARHAVYVVTEKRVIIKNGAALAFMISLPFKKIASVNQQKRNKGIGTISFELVSDKRVPFISCWPSVRPLVFKKPQPAFACIADVEAIGEILKEAMLGNNQNMNQSRVKNHISEIQQGA